MADSPKKLRLFIALNLPESVKDAVAAAQRELRNAAPEAAIRWTTPDQFHVTLKFLGEVDADTVPALTRALAQACAAFPPLQAQAENIGFFPSQIRPRVIWIAIHDRAQNLRPLQEAVQTATQPFTEETPENRFAGHVTLGRIREFRRSDAEALTKVAKEFTHRTFGEWQVREIHLIQSQLSPSGAKYTTLFAATLTDPL